MTSSTLEATLPKRDVVASAERVAAAAMARADRLDVDGAFPTDDIQALHDVGLLRAPLPAWQGGVALGTQNPQLLLRVLVALGRGSLSLGRLYEGHVNALALVTRYGAPANLALLAQEVDAGRPSGVWMAGEPLQLMRQGDQTMLCGRKVLCSGAGHFRRPLVAADHDGGSVMVIPRVPEGRADAGMWTAHGMRATASGTVDFEGIAVAADEIIGQPGDYLRSPYFRGGAWRVLAVQLGGLEALLELYRASLRQSPHRDHPLQLARFGEAQIAVETARLWVREAASMAEGPFCDAADVDAYVDLARNAFEAVALKVVELAQKAIGLKAFLRPAPIERVIRDLSTYLRQPALDISLLSAAAHRLKQSS